MKPTHLSLFLSCLSILFATTSRADPIEVSASISGTISGRGGIDQTPYFIGGNSLSDFDPFFANASPYMHSGGDSSAAGSLSGGAIARHPEDHGDPGLLGIDLAGGFTASREPTGAVTSGGLASFFPAGSMSVGLQASAEYRDEVTIELEHPEVGIVSVDAFVILEGFAALDAVATGGIPPSNVVASIGGRLTGAGDNPVVFGTIKDATGKLTTPTPSFVNILDFNPVINFSYDFISGVPFPLFLKLELTGKAEFGDVSFATLSPGFASASFEAHFGNTLKWGGITRVVNRSTGEEITDYRITSASGFDYTQTFSIPEPGSLALLLFGVSGFFCRRSWA